MDNTSDTNDDNEPQQLNAEEEQQAEAMVARALAAIESGQQPEGVFNALLAGLPAHLQETIRRRVNGELEKRKNLRQQQIDEYQKQQKQQKEQGQTSALKVFSMAIAAKLIGQQTLGRISALLNSRPDLQQAVKQAGEQLQRHGVQPDAQTISEAELGRVAPSVGHAQQQDRERGI